MREPGGYLLIVSRPGTPDHDDDVIACASLHAARAMLMVELEATAEAVGIWSSDQYLRFTLAQAEIAEPPIDIHLGGFVHTITWGH